MSLDTSGTQVLGREASLGLTRKYHLVAQGSYWCCLFLKHILCSKTFSLARSFLKTTAMPNSLTTAYTSIDNLETVAKLCHSNVETPSSSTCDLEYLQSLCSYRVCHLVPCFAVMCAFHVTISSFCLFFKCKVLSRLILAFTCVCACIVGSFLKQVQHKQWLLI